MIHINCQKIKVGLLNIGWKLFACEQKGIIDKGLKLRHTGEWVSQMHDMIGSEGHS